jgi:hypothetical protein
LPISTNLNVAPWYDDFDANNLYYRVLFKPSQAVQARELTQLQTILQNQVESFADWAFQNGDIVTGGAIYDVANLPYVRLSDAASNGASYDVVSSVNALVTSLTSNLQARVVFATPGLQSNYPNTQIVYLNYLNTGNDASQTFGNNEQLVFSSVANGSNLFVVNTYTSNASTITNGNAHGISVADGVVFINGTFVKILEPTFGIVNAYGTDAGNSVVGFVATETIVTYAQDPSLLDNALGYTNVNAPGADRLKISCGLLTLDPNTAANTVGFNPIATYSYGSLVSATNSQSQLYSTIGSAIASRVYDEAGNFVVNPFAIDTITSSNSVSANLAPDNALARIGTGKGYAQGYPVEVIKTAYVQMRRGVDTNTFNSQQISFNYGGYAVLDQVAGNFAFTSAQTVRLYDTAQFAVTNRAFTSLSPVGNQIGTATVRCFSYNDGTPGNAGCQYALHLYNIAMNSGASTTDIQSIVYYNGSVMGVGDMVFNGIINPTISEQLYTFGVSGLENLRDQSNNVNTEYVYRASVPLTITAGIGTYTITTSASGGVDVLPYGIGVLTDPEAKNFTLVNTSNNLSSALSGTITVSSANTLVTGSSTTFDQNFIKGSQILVGSTVRTITSVKNSSQLYVDAAFSANASGQTYYKYWPAGAILPISSFNRDVTGLVEITNSTSFSVAFSYGNGDAPVSALTCVVDFDVLRTGVHPAAKIINKNRFVAINTASSANPAGPFCLGFPDVHAITAVYGSANGSYGTSGSLITSQFVFDSGGTDTNYGPGYLYPTSSYSQSDNPYLLVQLDYFSINNSPGVGFFTVESYPIDDANTANATAITTTEIPVYVDSQGVQRPLRDYVDFRTPAVSTANDTGYVDTTNAAAVATAITYATTNPLANVSFNIPGTGINNPAWGWNMQSDFTAYLPRNDLVYITPDNILKIKEGVSSVSPQPPLFPDNAMALAVIAVPPYPSLTSDQVDALTIENKSSKSISRDVSKYMSTSLVTNRRYTMKDIGTLDSRITNLEYCVSLNMLQQSAMSVTVLDASGNDRFKNGIFADPLNDFSYCDVSDHEFSVAIDSVNSVARPKIVRTNVAVNFNYAEAVNTVRRGRVTILPYTHQEFLNQSFATKYRSAALVAYAWNGVMTLLPSYNNEIDTNTTGSASITINNTSAWNQFANSPYASIWGDWRTATSTVSNTIVTTNTSTTSTAATSTPSSTWTSPFINNGTPVTYNNGLFVG